MEHIEGWPGEFRTLAPGRRAFVRYAAGDAAATPVVYVHGLGGASTNWTALMRRAPSGGDQWAPDLAGFGESPPAGRHTVGEYVADIIAFLESVDRPAHLVGNSLGGLVSVLVAARRPDLPRTLSLISPAMPQHHLPWAAQVFAVMAVPGLGERLLARANAQPSEKQVAQLAAVLFADLTAIPVAELMFAADERDRWAHQPYADTVMLAALRSVATEYLRPPRRSAWAAARRVLCPTLVVMGGKDMLVGSWGAARWRRTRAHTRLAYLPTSGHVAMMERPDLVAELLRDFFRDTSRDRTPRSGMADVVAPLATERTDLTN